MLGVYMIYHLVRYNQFTFYIRFVEIIITNENLKTY